ncbi:MAG: AbrB/MazE/SpoVT family DNA-binding domain-containing protein [Nanoarchaeota archaeon]
MENYLYNKIIHNVIQKMEILTKTRKIGGSLIVTIPKNVVEEQNLKENQSVIIEIKKCKKSGFGVSKGLASFSKEDRFRGQLEK